MSSNRRPRSVPIIAVLVLLGTVVPIGSTRVALAAEESGAIERDYLEPVGDLYTQIVAVEARGVRTLYVSGQVGGGETLEAQSIAAFGNLKRRLEATGASVEDVVKLTTYVVDWTHEKADAAFAGFHQVYQGDKKRLPAHTLVGVQALYSPRAMIEVEAVAVVAAE